MIYFDLGFYGGFGVILFGVVEGGVSYIFVVDV